MAPDVKRLRLAGICGVAAPIVALLCIFIAISLSPWFRWSSNALSDLGVGGASQVFNSGLIVGGILTIILALGMFASFKGQGLRRLGAVAFLLDAFCLLGIGVFSEAAGVVHYYFSVAFFGLLTISLLLLGSGAILGGSRKFGALTIAMGILAALPWAFGWSAVAVPEMLSALAATAWSAAQGARLYLDKP
jgi:hypothetical membrane protein